MFRPAPVGQTQSTVNGVRLFLFEDPQMVAASLSNMQVWRRTVNCGSLYPEVFYLQSILWSPGLKSSMKIVTLGHQLPSQKSRWRNSGLKQKITTSNITGETLFHGCCRLKQEPLLIGIRTLHRYEETICVIVAITSYWGPVV